MSPYRTTRSSRIARPVLAVLLFAATIAVGACSREAPPAQSAAQPEAAPAARFEARLDLVNNNGDVRYDGTVDSEASRKAVQGALVRAYGADHVSGEIAVDRGARPAPWQAALPRFLASFAVPGAALAFEGRKIELSGHAPVEDRKALLAKAELMFPGFTYTGLFQGAGDAASATDPASAVLAQVKPGTSGDDLVQALNEAVAQTPIRFEDGGARVAPESLALLSKAAEVIQAAGDGTRIEVAGPANGDPALARQRAEAIKVQLIVNGVSPAAIETTDQAGPGSAARFRLVPGRS
jgi:hypothetical protein